MKLFKNNNFINKELVRIEGKEYMFYHKEEMLLEFKF
jgi:hypothetical protein